MVAYFCREVRDSYRDDFRKLSQKFEVSRKFYLDSKKVSKKIYHNKVCYLEIFCSLFLIRARN